MVKSKSPNIESAAVVARVLSRKFKKAGFDMADTSDRYKWTKGIVGRRLGFSSTVAVDYHLPHEYATQLAKESVRVIRGKMKELLLSWGYILEDSGGIHIECQRD